MKVLTGGRRGVVLLVAVAVLSILAILATTFASMSRIERDVSRNYVDHVRAKLLAQAGVERGVQEVRSAIQGTSILPANFSAAEDVGKPWLYGKPMGGGTIFYEPSIPIERAIFCSFSTNPTTGANRTVKLEDRKNQKAFPSNPLDAGYGNDDFGVSGAMAGTYTANGDFYSLKVVDAASKICINGPDSNDDNPNPAIAAGATRLMDQVVTMLNNLGAILQAERGLAFADLGKRISDLRVTTGRNFIRAEELMPAFGATTPAQQAALDIVRPYITTAVWADSATLAPDSLQHRNPEVNGDPNLICNGGWRTTRSVGLPNHGGTRTADASIPDGPNVDCACPTTSGSDRAVSDIPSRWMGERNPGAIQTPEQILPANADFRTPRVPVNLNTAPREVLQAVLTDLQAGYLDRAFGPADWYGNGYSASTGTTVILSSSTAKDIAKAIVQRRNELVNSARKYGFATWYDFNAFIDAIDSSAALTALVPRSSVTPVTLDNNPIRAQAIKDMVKANANPNSHINKFNPDRAFGSRFGDTDKADLTKWTTEFCFNSDGCFEIESIGRVCAKPNATNQMPIVAETVIRTSMRVFDVYRISTQKEFVANQIGASGAGALVPYPEHLSDIGGNNQSSRTDAAAAYDGYLMLDTVDTNDVSAAAPNVSFFANYERDFGADAAGPAEQGTSLVANQTGGNPSGGGQSELFTDGFFNHRTRRYASYVDIGGAASWGAANIGAVDEYIRNGRADVKISMAQGTIDMWVKPTWAATGIGPSPAERPDFATQQSNSADNPKAVSRKTLFSVGEGTTAQSYPAPLNSSTLEVSDNRIYMYAAYDSDGVYLMGSECTRLCNVPNGLVAQWYKDLDSGSHNVIDRSTQSRNHTNWVPLRRNAAADAESKYTASTNAWNPKGWRYAGGWHHVRFCWNGEMSWMFVDGQPGGDDPLTGHRAPSVPANIKNTWSLFVGSNRFKDDETNGYPCNADCTIDGVKIYRTNISTSSFTPPQRYVGSGVYTGKIGPRKNVLDNNVQPFDVAGKVACVSWTVNVPRFSGTPTSCTLEIGKGGAYSAVSPNMSGGAPPELAGRGTAAPNLSLVAGENLDYRVTMTSGLPDQLASPILDDVSVMVIPSSPRFLYYSIE